MIQIEYLATVHQPGFICQNKTWYAKTRLGKLPARVKRTLLKLRFAIRQKENAEVWLVILNHF